MSWAAASSILRSTSLKFTIIRQILTASLHAFSAFQANAAFHFPSTTCQWSYTLFMSCQLVWIYINSENSLNSSLRSLRGFFLTFNRFLETIVGKVRLLSWTFRSAIRSIPYQAAITGTSDLVRARSEAKSICRRFHNRAETDQGRLLEQFDLRPRSWAKSCNSETAFLSSLKSFSGI